MALAWERFAPVDMDCCLRFGLLLISLLFLAPEVRGHDAGTSYLNLDLREGRIDGRWAIALPDLVAALRLDLNGDGTVSVDELRAGQAAVHEHARSRLRLNAHGRIGTIRFLDTEPKVEKSLGESNLVLSFLITDLPMPKDLRVEYRLMFDVRPRHRGLLRLALVGFNLGVEAGQVVIVAAFLPVAYGLRASWFYQRVVLQTGSCLVALVASVWLVERVGGWHLLPF